MIRVKTTSNVRASLTPAELAFFDAIRAEPTDGWLNFYADTERGPFYGRLTLVVGQGPHGPVSGPTFRTSGASMAAVVESLLVELERAR